MSASDVRDRGHAACPWPSAIPFLGSLALALFLGGCESHRPEQPNQAPTVEVLPGPLEQDPVSYRFRLFWSGHDPDGYVVRFEVTVDPPAAFTEDEIRNGGADLSAQLIAGEGGQLDRTRVSKETPGGTVSMDWFHTREFSRRLRFTFEEDAANGKGVAEAPHAVFVRAVDDRGAASPAAGSAFTAVSVAPATEILHPNVSGDILTMGREVRVRFGGNDPDGSDGRPVRYLTKLVEVGSVIGATVEDLWQDPAPWVESESPLEWSALRILGRYVFGVRAVNESGVADPFLVFGRNAFKFQVWADGGYPVLTVCEPFLDCRPYTGTEGSYAVQFPVGREMELSWDASAEAYGGTIDAYSWGIDVPDLEAEGPGSGWSGWGAIHRPFSPVVFAEPGIHALYVRARDTDGRITRATLVIEAVPLPMDRGVLLVDDARDDTGPSDSQRDRFWRDLFEASERFEEGGYEVWEVYGPDDRAILKPRAPDLEDMGRYRLLVWDVLAGRFGTAAGNAAAGTGDLRSFLALGGQLWLSGTAPVTSIVEYDCFVAFGGECVPQPGDFVWEFLKIRSEVDVAQTGRDRLLVAIPVPGSSYPLLEAYVDPRIQGEIGEAVTNPVFLPDPPGVLENVYLYGAAGPRREEPESSPFEGRTVGLRWHDPDPQPAQGRVQWFGFPLHSFELEALQEVFNRSIDWFREEGVS